MIPAKQFLRMSAGFAFVAFGILCGCIVAALLHGRMSYKTQDQITQTSDPIIPKRFQHPHWSATLQEHWRIYHWIFWGAHSNATVDLCDVPTEEICRNIATYQNNPDNWFGNIEEGATCVPYSHSPIDGSYKPDRPCEDYILKYGERQ